MTPVVVPATTADAPVLGAMLGRAFADDPIWRWVYPQPDRSRRLATMFDAFVRATLAAGATVLTDSERRGAAIWLRSERRNLGVVGNLRMGAAMVAGRARMRRGQAVISTMERHHPDGSHWYLAVVGTEPSHQGHGIGSALIRAVLDDPSHRYDAAYLETETESNVPFYRRHGFEVVDEVDIPRGGPHLWLMWRDPNQPP